MAAAAAIIPSRGGVGADIGPNDRSKRGIYAHLLSLEDHALPVDRTGFYLNCRMRHDDDDDDGQGNPRDDDDEGGICEGDDDDGEDPVVGGAI